MNLFRKIKRAIKLYRQTNRQFYWLHYDKHLFLNLDGARGSGKSFFAMQKMIERCVSEEGHRMLAICRRARDEALFAVPLCDDIILSYYSDENLEIKRVDFGHKLKFENGSEIFFTTAEYAIKALTEPKTGICVLNADEFEASELKRLARFLIGKSKRYKQMILDGKVKCFVQRKKHWKLHKTKGKGNRFGDGAKYTMLRTEEMGEHSSPLQKGEDNEIIQMAGDGERSDGGCDGTG